MATESKVQKVARKVKTTAVKRIGPCGHEVVRAMWQAQRGPRRFRWYCETCFTFDDGRNDNG